MLTLCLALALAALPVPPLDDDGATRARRFVELLNADDVEAYGVFREQAFADVRPGEGWRDTYASLRERFGRLEIRGIEQRGGEVRVACAAEARPGEEVTFVFGLALPEQTFVSLSLSIESDAGGLAEQAADRLGAPPPEVQRGMSAAELERALDPWLDALHARDAFSGVVLVRVDGATVLHEARGLADRSFEVPFRTDTLVRIGSITKTHVQVAVAKLIAGGALDPAATLAELLPEHPEIPNAARITVRHLLEHRSGLPDFDWPAFVRTPNRETRRPLDYLPFLVNGAPAFEPGTREAYSNAGYILLGAVIEAVTGERYEDVVTRLAMREARMPRAGFFAVDRANPGVATGYWRCEGPDGDWCDNRTLLEVEGTASGGSYATAAELADFYTALQSGEVLDEAWTHWVFTGTWPGEGEPDPAAWSTGWAGGAEGVSAILGEQDGVLVCALTNHDEPSAELVGMALFGALLGGR